MTESDMWLRIKAKVPAAVRLETTVGFGIPDVLNPVTSGDWGFMELKLLKPKHSIYVEKTQWALYHRTERMLAGQNVFYIVIWASRSDGWYAVSSSELIKQGWEPEKGKIRVFLDKQRHGPDKFESLDGVLEGMAVTTTKMTTRPTF